jgi:hypothetical protein
MSPSLLPYLPHFLTLLTILSLLNPTLSRPPTFDANLYTTWDDLKVPGGDSKIGRIEVPVEEDDVIKITR